MNKLSKIIAGKGFYFILAVCLIAVGAAGFLAVSSSKIAQENTDVNTDGNSSIIMSKTESATESSASEKSAVESTEKKVNDEPKTVSKAEEPAAVTDNSFCYPTSNGKVTKKYDGKNLQYSATFSDMRIHPGTDIEAENGAEIKACAAGKVKQIYTSETLGRVIEIDHGNGLVIKYCGIADDITVKQDSAVTKGQKLGTLSGSPCESADAPHLHIEATVSGKYTDPEKLFK